MFKIARTPTFKARVDVVTANNKGGVDRSHFMAEFSRSDVSELETLRKMKPREIMERKLVGWSDLIDENNQQVEFTELNKEIVFSIPEALLAMTQTFLDTVVIAREKN